MGPVVRLIGSGIGLASEALAHHKAKKAEAEAAATNASSTIKANESRAYFPQATPGSGSAYQAQQNPHLIEVSDQQAAELVSRGQAVQVGYNESHEPTDAPPSYDEVMNDEEDWELDEAGGEHQEAGYSDSDKKPDVRETLGQFLQRHPTVRNLIQDSRRLPCPVIIPQSRPRTKSRGFVRAYAPVLGDCGIDQETWMDFLETFHKASQASPIFSGILVAGHLVGYVPSISAMVASMLVQATATAAIVVQSLSRTNTFLDDVNERFFRPRGLFVLLIKYKGSRNRWSSEPLDISHAIATSSVPADAAKKGNVGAKFKHNLQYASGTSHGDMEIPESAPLIYPALDNAAADALAAEPIPEGNQEDPNKPKAKPPGKFRRSSNFVNDYLDRRAQATFHAENPTLAALHTPGAGDSTQFSSRYSDPTHPASSGSLVALLTGGKVDPKGKRRIRDQRIKESTGIMPPLGYARKYQPVRRMLQQEVLYMMVVNMPAEEEIQAAKREMEGKGERLQEGEIGEDEE